MKQFFSGMLPFEVILAFMGIIIFLALVFLLVWNVMKQRAFISLLPFFLVPVFLVGYPSVQSIQFMDDGLSIQKYTNDVNSNPSDTSARRQLTTALHAFNLNPRSQKNAGALTTIADAQLALGNPDSAAIAIKKAIRLEPQSETVKTKYNEVNRQLALKEAFQTDITQLKQAVIVARQNPSDTVTAGRITQLLSGLQHPTYMDQSSALVIANAYAMINQRAKSAEVVDQVLKSDPHAPEALKLKSEINSNQSAIIQTTPSQKTMIINQLKKQPTFNAVVR